MTDYAILLFTFSPVQAFIAEARRAEDLFNGSKILVKLAKAAAEALGKEYLVYPAGLDAGDVPNVLTAKIPTSEVESRAKAAQEALLEKWKEIAQKARKDAKLGETDAVWENIWQRQVFDTPFWQFFWAAAEMKGNDPAKAYKEAYLQARDLLGAVKHSRAFAPIYEPGVKDSLSGQREALHRDRETAKQYWKSVAALSGMNSRLRPEGRERLDSIGLVKRFAKLRQDDIPSVSRVAAWDFYLKAHKYAKSQLSEYRKKIAEFANGAIYEARKDSDWPFDGDLFFMETLTPGRMADSYHIENLTTADLEELRATLHAIYDNKDDKGEKIGPPSPYYAIIVLDGDGMGKHLEELLKESDPEKAHRDFSANLATFSEFAQSEVTESNGGFMVYNGGDDVVCLASREKAIGLAKRLADEFYTLTDCTCTASAGIVIAHHLTPLSIVLEEARRAEKAAKAIKKSPSDSDHEKNAVCVTLLKRSGSPLMARSKWDDLRVYCDVLKALNDDEISARLPYALERDALTLAALNNEGQIAGLKYLLRRQVGAKGKAEETKALAKPLQEWAANLDSALANQNSKPPCEENKEQDNEDKKAKFTPGLPEVAHWLVLARFMASDGGE